MYNRLSKCKTEAPTVYGTYNFVSWLKGFNNPVAYSLKYKIGLLLAAKINSRFIWVKPCFHAHILLVVDKIFVHEKCSKPVNRHLFGY